MLSIWNARVDGAMGEHTDLRVAVLVRNIKSREFVLFEEQEARRFTPDDYEWEHNKQNNPVRTALLGNRMEACSPSSERSQHQLAIFP